MLDTHCRKILLETTLRVKGKLGILDIILFYNCQIRFLNMRNEHSIDLSSLKFWHILIILQHLNFQISVYLFLTHNSIVFNRRLTLILFDFSAFEIKIHRNALDVGINPQ
jgi:hypothetical protein